MAYAIPGVQGGNGGGYSQTYNADGTPTQVSNDGPAAKQPERSNTMPVEEQKKGIFSNPNYSQVRRENAGLNEGGANSPKSAGQEPYVEPGATKASTVQTEDDWRVRISLPPNSNIFYKAAKGWGDLFNDKRLLTPLMSSGINGVVFPYTPQISITHSARYQEQALTHSNFKNYFYEGSDVSAITISGEFTVQNQKEGEYVMACIYFLRSCTRMFFGQSTTYPVGTPPPIVYLDGYGKYMLPHVSCVITNFTQSMPADVDYMPLYRLNTRVPTSCTLAVTLQPVYSRKRIHEDFNLDSYSQGKLTGAGDKRNIGGFL